MEELYIFDLDGTLLDSDRMLIETFRTLYKMYRPGYNPTDSYICTFSGPQISETIQKEFPGQDFNLMMEEWKKYSSANYIKHACLFPGAKECLIKMKEKGIKFGVVTNKHRYATDNAYKLYGCEGLIPYTVCADEVTKLKPDSEGILRVMNHFGVTDKSKVIYIGDGEIDYQTAKNAGVKFGLVSWTPRKISEGAKIDMVIESYPRFAGEFK